MLFSDEITTPEGNGENCYGTELAFATPYVKNVMSQFIDDYTTGGETDYEIAIEKGFSYFDPSSTRRKPLTSFLGHWARVFWLST